MGAFLGREGKDRFIFFSVPIHRVYNALTAGHAPFGSSLRALHGIINHFAEPLNRKRILYAPFVPVIDGQRIVEDVDRARLAGAVKLGFD